MKRNKPQFYILLPVLTALALTLLVAQLSAQDDVVVPDVGFEIEGNAALDHGGGYDWETVDFGPAVLVQDPNSKATTDPTTFRPNSKFDTPEEWSIVPSPVGPGQNELTNVMTWGILPNDLAAGRPDDFWLILGMERTKQEGTFDLDFEFNQEAWDGSSGGPTRTPGDLVVGFELKGNPTDRQADLQILIIQYSPGAQPSLCKATPGPAGIPSTVDVGSEPCPPYGDSGWFYRLLADGMLLADSGLGQATMNEDPFSVPEWWLSSDAQGTVRSDVGPFQFAEAAINLTALGIQVDCSTFSTVHAKSRSSLEVQSDLKDLAGPAPLRVNCRLDGHKFLDVDGNSLWDRPDEPPLEGWLIKLSDGHAAFTDAEGYYAFEDLPAGTYTVTEACPDDWAQTAPGLTDFDTCGDLVHTAELDIDHREVNLPDFGNGQPALSLSCRSPADVFVGDEIEYTITVTNSGNVALPSTKLQDSRLCLNETIDLAPAESRTFTGTYSTRDGSCRDGKRYRVYLPLIRRGIGAPPASDEPVPDMIANPVTATSQYALATIEAFDDCVTNLHSLEVSEEIQTSLERQYFYEITKVADNPGPIGLYVRDLITVEYTITIDPANPPFVDRGWATFGTITLSNPAPMDAELESVTEVLSPGRASEPECPSRTVPAGGFLTCTYRHDRLPDGSDRTSTATATLINNDGQTTGFSATTDVDFGQASIEEIDERASVSDSWKGFLGLIRHDQVPVTYHYSREFRGTGEVCGLRAFDNVASFVTNDTSTTDYATATVEIFEVCTITVAYEDLPRVPSPPDWPYPNDWDYNDLVVTFSPVLTVSAQDELLAARLTIALTRTLQTALHHTVNLQLDCDGEYTKTVTIGGSATITTGTFISRETNIPIIPNTHAPPDLVELRIDYEGPCRFDSSTLNPTDQYHGEWLFFDPWLSVWETGEEIHVGQPPEGYECECRILTVPTTWVPPGPGKGIWEVYPKVLPPPAGDPGAGPTFCPCWWILPGSCGCNSTGQGGGSNR